METPTPPQAEVHASEIELQSRPGPPGTWPTSPTRRAPAQAPASHGPGPSASNVRTAPVGVRKWLAAHALSWRAYYWASAAWALGASVSASYYYWVYGLKFITDAYNHDYFCARSLWTTMVRLLASLVIGATMAGVGGARSALKYRRWCRSCRRGGQSRGEEGEVIDDSEGLLAETTASTRRSRAPATAEGTGGACVAVGLLLLMCVAVVHMIWLGDILAATMGNCPDFTAVGEHESGAADSARQPHSRPRIMDPKTPNVLFIVIDDLRYDGPWLADAPHYRSLLSEGTVEGDAGQWHRFDHAYAPWPVCGPSRSAFMTGLYASTTGLVSNSVINSVQSRDLQDWKTLPERFSDGGRATASVGKVFHGSSFKNSFQYDARVGLKRDCPPPGLTRRPYMWCKRSWWWSPPDGDELIAETTIKTIRALDRAGRAFFLAVGFHKPHMVWPLDDASWDRNANLPPGVDASMRGIPANASMPYKTGCLGNPHHGGHLPDGGDGKPVDVWATGSCESGYAALEVDAYIEQVRRAYCASFSRTDDQVGKVLSEIKRYEWWNNTIVIATSDHGFSLGENNHIAKHHLYDVEMRVPLGLRLPPSVTERTGSRPRRFVSLLDLYPTLTRLANIQLDQTTIGRLDGTDLFESDLTLTNSKTQLAALLRGSGVGNATGYTQAVYPIVEEDGSECLVLEELRFVRNTNASARQVPGTQELSSSSRIHDLYLLPTQLDNPYHCNITEGLHGNVIQDGRFEGEVTEALGRFIDVQRSREHQARD